MIYSGKMSPGTERRGLSAVPVVGVPPGNPRASGPRENCYPESSFAHRSRLIYRIEDIEVDCSQASLKRGGYEQNIRQQSFQVLLYMLEQRHRLVSKEELVENFWRGAAVTDNAIVQCIADIRKVLCDDSRHPRFIKTIPKVGYRFIGPVHEEYTKFPSSVDLEKSRPGETSQVTGSKRRFSGVIVIVALLTAMSVLSFIALWYRNP